MEYLYIIGYIAIIFNLLGFLSTSIKKSLILGLMGASLYTINIYLSGAISATILSSLGIFLTLIAIFVSDNMKRILAYLTPLLAIIVFFIIDEGLLGLLPTVGTFFASLAKLQTDIFKMKIIYLGSASSWLIFGIILQEPSTILFDLFGLFGLLYTIYNINLKRKTNIFN